MVEIKIMGDTHLEALSSLTAFGMHCMANEKVLNAANHILEAEQQDKAGKATAEPEKPPKSAAEDFPTPGPKTTPGAAQEAEIGPTAPPTDTPPQKETPDIPTAEEVTIKGRDAAKKYGAAAIKPLLKEFGVDRMSELAEKDRAAFLTRLESLGENDA